MPQSRAQAIRSASIMLSVQVWTAVVLTPVIFYLLAFTSKPHHVATASAVACGYLVLMGGSGLWVFRVRTARASKLSDTEPSNS